ncbi:hypothetical protein AYO38_04210 [bacterium SCGC AG-212-C10]|nr:hypothetical protein AYO38_04210 [bacterium SCGC AG-212-C10]
MIEQHHDAQDAADIERLRHDLQQFQEFLEGMPDAIIDIDLRTLKVVAINHMTTIVTGFTAEDVAAGLHAHRLAPPEENARMTEISLGFIRRGLEAGGGVYKRASSYNAFEVRLLRRDGTEYYAEVHASYVLDEHSRPTLMRGTIRDISERKAAERAHEETIAQLRGALEQVKTLEGLIPICAWCHRIRDDQGYWQQLEKFLTDHSRADFTHAICESCSDQMSSRFESGKAG